MAARPAPKSGDRPQDDPPVPARTRSDVHPIDRMAAQSAATPTGPPAGRPEGQSADAPADGRARPPARVGADAPADGPVSDADGATDSADTQTAGQAPTAAVPLPGTRRELEVAARSYKSGLARLNPRVVRLTEAIRAVLAAGGTAREIQAVLAEVGLPADELPRESQQALRKR